MLHFCIKGHVTLNNQGTNIPIHFVGSLTMTNEEMHFKVVESWQFKMVIVMLLGNNLLFIEHSLKCHDKE
jgi:hypothetical protein